MEETNQSVKGPVVGLVTTGTVIRVYPTYAIMLFDDGWTGLLHISELSHSYIRSFTSFVSVGSIYTVKVIDVFDNGNRVNVSLKQVSNSERKRCFSHKPIDPSEISFESLKACLPYWIEQQNKEN
ncbi:MAG: S1 RNA-binding domain-containing protein [Bacilli bacterium]|nr:S1 RNA-binding domain-containing protein [Bacilli bacterium]MBO6284787.1 S1 RNA-binding domain-containing protein [Bacilli bacterium]